MIEKTVELLETAYATKDWELVLEAIHLLNEIPDRDISNEEDSENSQKD